MVKLTVILLVAGVCVWLGFVLGLGANLRKLVSKASPGVIAKVEMVGALLCFLIAAGFSIYSLYFLAVAQKGMGTVIELREKKRDEKQQTPAYAPVVRFEYPSGIERTVISSVSSYPPNHNVGQTLPVLFLKSNPARARIDGFWEHWGGAIVFCRTWSSPHCDEPWKEVLGQPVA